MSQEIIEVPDDYTDAERQAIAETVALMATLGPCEHYLAPDFPPPDPS
jgi:hypothetical protein